MLRILSAWLIGLSIFVALGVALTEAGVALGVPSFIELDGPTTVTHGSGRSSYDEEIDSTQTGFGMASGMLAFLIALWAGQAAYARSWRAGFTPKGWLTFRAWLMALSILAVVAILTHLAFRSLHGGVAAYARLLIELGATAGIGWACHQWWKNRAGRL